MVFLLYPADNVSCISGLHFDPYYDIDETSSRLVALPRSDLSEGNFVQWIFPNIRFTCNGSITSWKLRVDTTTMESDAVQRPIPQLSTWRARRLFEGDTAFMRNSTTNESLSSVMREGSVYEYVLSSPIPVQSGDIVGIKMPSNATERRRSVRPLFVELSEGNSSTRSCSAFLDSDELFISSTCAQFTFIPLVTAVIGQLLYKLHCYTQRFSLTCRSIQ